MNNIFENISLTLILLKIFDIYLCCYCATNKKIAITHLWHAIQPQNIYHLIGGHGGRVVTLSPPTSEVGGSIPVTALSGKAGSCLPLVGSLQYTTLANSMYWFPLPFQLPVVI